MFDIENQELLRAYLIENNRISANEPIKFHVLEGGVSNRTVLLNFPNGDDWVLKQALEKLRVQVDWFCSPKRVHREALGIRWLQELAPKGSTVPLIFEDHDHHIIAMKAVPQPHQNWKEMLLNGEIIPDHFVQFARLLANIHIQSFQKRDELSRIFDDKTFFEQLRLEPFYEYPASYIESAQPFLMSLIQETRSLHKTLVHGDYSPKNILVHQNQLILLDHEVIHFGDPAFDIGFSMAHLLSKAHALPPHRTRFGNAAVMYWKTYLELVNRIWDAHMEARCVRHTLGCLLARAAGRSTMNYFTPKHKDTQKNLSVSFMQNPPAEMHELINQFVNGLNHDM